jgi:hypothetical protein
MSVSEGCEAEDERVLVTVVEESLPLSVAVAVMVTAR